MNESLRYLDNAREILKNSPIEDNNYSDVKCVQEACGTAYLAVLKAIDEYLLKKGLNKKELPRLVDGYRKALQKYLAIHNGKLLKSFENLYHELHIAGYYRGDIRSVKMVKGVLEDTKAFIERIE